MLGAVDDHGRRVGRQVARPHAKPKGRTKHEGLRHDRRTEETHRHVPSAERTGIQEPHRARDGAALAVLLAHLLALCIVAGAGRLGLVGHWLTLGGLAAAAVGAVLALALRVEAAPDRRIARELTT